MAGKVVIIGGCAGAKVAYDIFVAHGLDCVFMENFTEDWGVIKPKIVEGISDKEPFWFVATGDNVERQAMTKKWGDVIGYDPISAPHPASVISPFSPVGFGNLICANAVVGVGSHVGDGVIINTAATVDHDCRVGDFAQICPGAHLCGYVEVGERAFVGAGAVVIPHIKIGHDAVVAAGAVVIHDVEPFEMVAGVPAQRKKVLA